MTLLIVDDEILAIQGILDDTPWKELPEIDRILTANSYSQAVNLFMENRIDILLCDIEMPYGTGIDLVRWLRGRGEETECIFLTCFDSFDYAKTALELECIGYVLKPADTEEIVANLRKALEKIIGKRQSKMGQEYWQHYVSSVQKEEPPVCGDPLKEAEQYIREHIAEDISVRELAVRAHVSETHLGRLFKKKHGLTPVDYIHQQRITVAKELLGKPVYTISQVAAMVGFNNYSYFTKTFRKYTGMTPREYRQSVEG